MRSFFFFASFIFSHYCYSQEPGINNPLVLSNISEQNGLSDDHVQCLLKDKDGFVWIGTTDGLNLMDGSTIKIFRHKENDSTSLPGSNIETISEDSINAILYIGTTKGLCFYDKRKKTFSSAFPPGRTHEPSNYDPILHVKHPVTQLSHFFIMGNNKKSLVEFIPEIKK